VRNLSGTTIQGVFARVEDVVPEHRRPLPWPLKPTDFNTRRGAYHLDYPFALHPGETKMIDVLRGIAGQDGPMRVYVEHEDTPSPHLELERGDWRLCIAVYGTDVPRCAADFAVNVDGTAPPVLVSLDRGIR
jgi:hypothetical protein